MSARQPGQQRNRIGQVRVLTVRQSKGIEERSVQPVGLHYGGAQRGAERGARSPANALNCGELQSQRGVRSEKVQVTDLQNFS